MPFVVGENVGPYRITKRLGVGGMATVWKAYHPALDRYVAIKVLHPSFKEDPQFTARFQREARIVAKLIHPHIVPIYDFSEHEGMSYLVMRFIEGRTLKPILKEGPLSLDRVLETVEPAGEGLAYAHEQGVLHRDIKPSNFIITAEGEVFLTDFGLARMAETTDSTLSRDMLVGTPQYISPEQVRGEKLDAGTDIYSLGVVLFEMLTGKVPYDADTPYAVIHDHIFSPLPVPSEFNPDIPEAVERVVLKALAKDRKDRFESVRDMISALKGAVPEEAVEAVREAVEAAEEVESVEMPRPRSRWRSRRFIAGVLGLGAVLTVCICSLLFLIVVSGSEERQARTDRRETVTTVREDPAAHTYLAGRYLQQGNIERAIAEYEVAIDLDPGAVDAYLGLGVVYLREKDPDMALDFYEQALDIERDNAKAHLGMGDAFVLLNEFGSAALHYERVVELDPGVSGPHAKLGICHVVQGDIEWGLEECERSLELDPRDSQGHFCMGLYFAQVGDPDMARRELKMVIDTAEGYLAEQARRQLDRLE
ncbi:MAG: protein kinase [Anaerolineae bacterium]